MRFVTLASCLAATVLILQVARPVAAADSKARAATAWEVHQALTSAEHALLVDHDIAAAENELLRAVALDPGRQDALVQLAWAAFARRDWPTLEARLAAVEKLGGRKVKQAKAKGKGPTFDEVAEMRAVLAAPERHVALQAQQATALLDEGIALFERGHIHEAAYLFTLASAANPAAWAADAWLARVAARLGLKADAAMLLERSAARAPTGKADVLRAQASRLRADLAAAEAAEEAQTLVQKRQFAAAGDRYWQAWTHFRDREELLVAAVAMAVASRDPETVARYMTAAGPTITPAVAAILAKVAPGPQPSPAVQQ